MNIDAYLVIAANFVAIGVLPVVFFKRDGAFNWKWWVTALPFLMSIGSVTAIQFGALPASWVLSSTPATAVAMRICSTLLSLSSISLIMLTLGSHRIPIALWHQTNDAPQHLVTWGAYSRIRHPFYASFLLAFLASVLYCPQALTLAGLLCGALILNATAAKEEKLLCSSEFGAEYQAYMQRAGRFMPRWGYR